MNAKIETKFTPGPWEWEGSQLLATRETHSESVLIAEGIGEADKRLIAAAPEMLATLQRIRAWYEEKHLTLLNGITPVCFSEALSVIQKSTQP